MRKATWWMGLAAAVGLTCGAQAAKSQIRATVVSGGVTWSYSIGEDGAIVTGADPAKGRLAVPATLGGQSVVEIGYRAFASCEELTAVEIPEGTTRIGERAFQYCSALKEVSIPAGVTNVGTMAFQYCESLATLTLPQNLEDIGDNAFYHCSGLSTLYVPSTWWGTAKTSAAGVDSGCRTIYGEPGRETLFFNANGGTCGTVFRGYATGKPYGWLPDAERASHTFDGWFPSQYGGTRITETNAASDSDGSREVYAHWMPLVQTVTFVGNGGTSATRAYPCGELYSPLPESTRPNYAFAGWWTASYGGERITEASTVTQERTRTLYAHWTLTEQTVWFDAQGGACDTATRNYDVGGTYSSLPKPTREGYDFDGWFTASSGGDRVSAASAVTQTDGRTLYAHWSLVEQVVAFDANGGTCDIDSRAYAVGGTYTWLPEAERERYVFAGWWSGLHGGEEVAVTDTVTATRYRTLYAHWIPMEQTVTFEANGGRCDTSTRIYAVGSPYGALPAAERDHYSFAGWMDGNGESVTEASEVTPTETRTLYAQWTLAEQTVTFNPTEGRCDTASGLYTVGKPYAHFPEAVREHYVFAGWWTGWDWGEEVKETNTVTDWETRTLYAHWTLAEQEVEFNANGGICGTSSRTYAVGGTYALLPEATREGYSFAGWWTSAGGGERVEAATVVPASEWRTLYAHWTPLVQVVTFDASGGRCGTATRTYAVGSPYGALPAAERDHYSFAGWTDGNGASVTETNEVTPTETRTLYARWTLTEQVAAFDANGGRCDTSTRIYAVGSPYGTLPTAERDHYSFAGWMTWDGESVAEASEVTPTETRTLYARWTLAEQVVTFDPNEGTCGTTNRVYALGDGKTYSLLPEATREGYAFAGWWSARVGGEAVGTGDAVTDWVTRTLYAHWRVAEQITTFFANGGVCDTVRRVYAVGEPYGWLPEATREGYAFAGWFEWADGGWTRVGGESAVTEERTRWLCALWKDPGETPLELTVEEFAKDGETGGFTVRFTGEEGKTYLLQRAQRLEGTPDWSTVETLEATQTGTCRMAAPAPFNWGQGFFRLAEGDGWLKSYLVVDMSGGSGASYWPVEELYDMPEGGWTDEYKTTKLVLRLLAPDTFAMGSPSGELGRNSDETQHDVTLTEPYFIGVFEVTQRQWELATGSNPSSYTGGTRPVESVSYSAIRGSSAGAGWPTSADVDSDSFLGVLREKTGLAFDLPTEAEWEYACRAGTTTALNSGKNLSGTPGCTNLAALGRYVHNQGDGLGGISNQHTVVGSYCPNAWGLHDMHGNVAEWCLDWPVAYSGAATNPVGAASGSYRSYRGGSWNNGAQYCRAAARASAASYDRQASRGLRVRCPEMGKYRVRFDANGGNGTMAEEDYYVGHCRPLSANSFWLDGHTFSGWATNPAGPVVVTDAAGANQLAAAAGDHITLYAMWTPNTYVVHFDSTGGTGWMNDQPFTYNVSQALARNDFTRDGYVFRGWMTPWSQGWTTGQADYADGAIVSNLTSEANGEVWLFAVWETISYRVHFDANGGDGHMDDQTFEGDFGQPLPTNAFVRDGFVFAGWSTNASGSVLYGDGEWVSSLTCTAGDVVVLYAQWGLAYTVQYHANGGEGEMEDQVFALGGPQRLRANAFTREGYAFMGWATSPDGAVEHWNGETVTDLTATAGSVVHLYAKWSPVYRVKFNANGGWGSMDEQVLIVGIPETLSYNEFEHAEDVVFAGWSTSKDGPVAYIDGATVQDLAKEPLAVVELHAVWRTDADAISIRSGDWLEYDEFSRQLDDIGYSSRFSGDFFSRTHPRYIWHLDVDYLRIEFGYRYGDFFVSSISLYGGAVDSGTIQFVDGGMHTFNVGDSYYPQDLIFLIAQAVASPDRFFWGVDVGMPTAALPVRIGFASAGKSEGYVSSMCRFDPETQETVEYLDHIVIPSRSALLY